MELPEDQRIPVTVGKNSVVLLTPNFDRLEDEGVIGLDCTVYLNVLGLEEQDEDSEETYDALLKEASGFFESALQEFASYIIATQNPDA